MTPGEMIRAARLEAGMTQEALAGRIGCSKAQLSLMESGRRRVSPERVAAIERALGVKDGRLAAALRWQSTPPEVRATVARSQELSAKLAAKLRKALRSRKPVESLRRIVDRSMTNIDALRDAAAIPGVPVINKVAAGYPTEFTDLDYPARIADEYVNCPDVNDPDAFAARVVGDSMEPDYREGDIVVFSPSLPTPSGCDCFIRLDDRHETTFKRIYLEKAGKMIRLQPLNNAYPPRVVDRREIAGMYAAAYVMRRIGRPAS